VLYHAIQSMMADLTYVATWRGFVYVAFVTDAFSRRIVGWRATTTLQTDLALDALEQALYCRTLGGPLVHYRDRGSPGGLNRSSEYQGLRRPIDAAPYLAIRYTDRLHGVGITSSVGSRGDAYDKALAETIDGRY
jgi:putative transposase